MADGNLEIVAWDVQHGVSLFVRTPNNRTIILDAGASDTFSPVDWLTRRYQLQQLDGLIVSHAHADHVREVGRIHAELKPRVVRRNKTVPTNLLYPNGTPTTDPLKSYYALDMAYNSPAEPTDRFGDLANWGGVQIRTFYNSARLHQFTNMNDYSLVTILDLGAIKYLFPGDLESPGWQALMVRDDFRTACVSIVPQVRVLVAPHHGHTAGRVQAISRSVPAGSHDHLRGSRGPTHGRRCLPERKLRLAGLRQSRQPNAAGSGYHYQDERLRPCAPRYPVQQRIHWRLDASCCRTVRWRVQSCLVPPWSPASNRRTWVASHG